MKRSSDDPGETDARIPAPSSLLVELIMNYGPVYAERNTEPT